MTIRTAWRLATLIVGIAIGALVVLRIWLPPKLYKSEWHPSCQVMAWFAPSHFPKPLQFSKASDVWRGYDTLGDCRATKRPDGLWHVIGTHYNQRMVLDRIAPVSYEALMIEDNDVRDPAVQRYGTQYLVCSVLIDGIDRTGSTRLNKCGEGRYILEYKGKYGI